jgi:hypothetical protein
MPDHLLLWALPGGWDSFELFQPDVEEQIAGRIRRRYAEAGLDPAAAEGIVAMELEAARQARDAGVLLWASYTEGAGTVEDPLRLLSLTIALQLPGETLVPTHGAPTAAPMPATGAVSIRPLVLDDPTLYGFTREVRTQARPPGGERDIPLFQVEAFVAPRDGRMLAALSVTTPDPAWEEEARTVAREVAGTLAFINVDGD